MSSEHECETELEVDEIGAIMFGATSGEEFVDCSFDHLLLPYEDHFSSENQPSIELQPYESNKYESLLDESEGSVSFSYPRNLRDIVIFELL